MDLPVELFDYFTTKYANVLTAHYNENIWDGLTDMANGRGVFSMAGMTEDDHAMLRACKQKPSKTY